MYPWLDTGVIQSFLIRTTTKKKIRVKMTPPPPLITTKPLAHSNSTTTTVRQRNPDFALQQLQNRLCLSILQDLCVLRYCHACENFTKCLLRHHKRPRQSITKTKLASCSRGVKRTRKEWGSWKMGNDVIFRVSSYSDTVLVKNQLLWFKDHRMMVLPTTSVFQSSLQ